MSAPKDDEMAVERFFETLAGREDSDACARRLREAILAEAEIERAAESATLKSMTGESRTAMEAVKRRLIAEGIFVDPTSNPRNRPPRA